MILLTPPGGFTIFNRTEVVRAVSDDVSLMSRSVHRVLQERVVVAECAAGAVDGALPEFSTRACRCTLFTPLKRAEIFSAEITNCSVFSA